LILTVTILLCLFASLPAMMVLRNRSLFPRAAFPLITGQQHRAQPQVSVLIPARDEAASIARSVNAALRSTGVEVEVVVLDDASTDATADIVAAMSQRDARVRLIRGNPLPDGWNGKQHACWQLADAARYPLILFLDADVRLSSDAIERLVTHRQQQGVVLLSAFPYQETVTFWERMLIPMMHFILLGFLPLDRMRKTTDPAFSAGCGQLFLTDAEAYQWAGTHAAIASSRHDGLKLPRIYREKKLKTDVCDGTDIAACRMYHDAGQVFRGLLKNATEGIANRRLIVPFTVLLLGSSVLPFVWFPVTIAAKNMPAIVLGAIAVILAWLPRFQCAVRFRQPISGAVLHPLTVTVFVALQWIALIQESRGKRIAWRGRTDS
jgi:glycosyltransferase involved in cell wall biosynthesis